MSLFRPALAGALRTARSKLLSQASLVSEPRCLVSSSCSLFHSSSSRASDAAEQRSPPSDQVKRLVEEIAALNLLEVADLTELLRKKLNIPDMPMMAMSAGAGPGSAAGGGQAAAKEEPKVEKTSFDVKLDKFDATAKIKIIKEVRAMTALGLKEAKDLVEKTPTVIKKGVSKEEAEEMLKKLSAAGATASIE